MGAARARRRGVSRAASAGGAALVFCAALAAGALAASTNFAERGSSPEAVGLIPVALATADLDGDLDPDLAVANSGSDDVSVLRNNGVGNFAEYNSSPEGAGITPASIAAADLDGDLDQDLAVVNGFDASGTHGDVTILGNGGNADFVEPPSSPEPAGELADAVATIDRDGDGDQDLAVANLASNDVTILRNNGQARFNEPGSSPEAAGAGPTAIAAADLDGDLDQDLAVANSGGDVTILRSNGSTNFVEPASSPEAAGGNPNAIVAADLDGDLDQDLAVANGGSDEITILRNAGNGNFAELGSSPEAGGDSPFAIAAADLEGDGDADLAVANTGSDDVTILANSGSGNFTEPATSTEGAGANPNGVVAADFDADLDPDLAVANSSGDDLTILVNR